MIRVEGLRRTFGSVIAANNVSFTARDGAVTGLLGPNGAGKTTSLRMIYGLLKPDAGRIDVDGLDLLSDPPRLEVAQQSPSMGSGWHCQRTQQQSRYRRSLEAGSMFSDPQC